MELIEAIEARHSVRSYLKKDIETEKVTRLKEAMYTYNNQADLSIQLCLNEAEAFDGILARYGVFTNVENYFALVAKKSDSCAQRLGYYGEKLVLLAQQLGLNTCWVGGTYHKRKTIAHIGLLEKLHVVIALGYGETQGGVHKMKSLDELCTVKGETPEWFLSAMEAVRKAPTAMNQQKFRFSLEGTSVKADTLSGHFTQIDLGIARCHFEIGAAAAGATDDDWYWV